MEGYTTLAHTNGIRNTHLNVLSQFVAHPSVQQHLVRIWHEDLNDMETHGWHVRLPVLAALALVYPIIVLAHFVKPDSKVTFALMLNLSAR